MREYRKRRRLDLDPYATPTMMRKADAQTTRITELEEEVRHLKAELAKRSFSIPGDRFNTRPFTPVPKSGKRG